MKSSLLMFFLFSIPSIIIALCMDGDFYHDGFCYNVPVFNGTEGLTHSDAQAYCSSIGATLRVFRGTPGFKSKQEDFVVLMLIRVFGKGFSWIGLTHPGKWDDGTNVYYTNWNLGYPKNLSHCVIEWYNYEKSNEGFWRDDHACDSKATFFCQYLSNRVTRIPVSI